MRLRHRVLSAGLTALCLSACWSPQGPAQPRLLDAAPPYMTKDDVLSVGGRRLSLSGYTALRGALPALSREAFFWVAIGALALQNDAQLRSLPFDVGEAVAVARYALGDLPSDQAQEALRKWAGPGAALPSPTEMRAVTDRLVSRSVVQRNTQILAELH